MNLDEMKKIASARTPGDWTIKQTMKQSELKNFLLPPAFKYFAPKKNCAFIAMASNHWDKLMAVVNAAKNIEHTIPCGLILTEKCECCDLKDALRDLESE